LRRRGWPGNVRELRNCVQRAMAVSRGPVLQERDFLHQTDVGLGAEGTTTLDLAEMEKRHIKAVIDAHQGNLRAAAESLGIARSTLYKKISEYDIE
ncbi:MAG TPA: helix-turn-helix domain-containing protein, partial [Candidatus Hydrogenedentes bacterium]|nr:helix-turn-helix domain-containing protein [Candidatus Hydrogenedentota bacterium]